GDKAAAELRRRSHTQPRPEQQAQPGSNPETVTETQWFRELDEDLQAAHRALTRQRQAATEAGQPWPPRPEPAPGPGAESHATSEWWRQFEADMAAVERSIERQHRAAIDAGRPWPPERRAQAGAEPEAALQVGPIRTEPATEYDDPAVRITEA